MSLYLQTKSPLGKLKWKSSELQFSYQNPVRQDTEEQQQCGFLYAFYFIIRDMDPESTYKRQKGLMRPQWKQVRTRVLMN